MAQTVKNKGLNQVKEAKEAAKARVMRPSECRDHMRRTLAKEFQGIVDGFVKAAKKGSCPHVKLATELLQPPPKRATRRKGSAARFLEKFETERQEKQRLQ